MRKLVLSAAACGLIFGSTAFAGEHTQWFDNLFERFSVSSPQGISGTNATTKGISGTNTKGISGTNSKGISGTNGKGISGTNTKGISGTNGSK